jgi:type II secretory pathway component GspD/PulD (secretin)
MCKCIQGGAPMKIPRCFLFLVIAGIMFAGHSRLYGAVMQQPAPQKPMPAWRSSQDGISFDKAPLGQFILTMMRRLRIDVVLVHNIFPKSVVTLHKNAPVSDQDLWDLFIAGLRDCNAMLVKNNGVYQIVPYSQNLLDGWETAVSLSQTVQASTSNLRMMLNYEGADLSDVLPQFVEMLNLTPIAINPYIKGELTVYTSSSISREKALAVFMALLKNNDAVLIELKGKYQIFPASKPLPARWTALSQPLLLKPGFTEPRRHVEPKEWETHILNRVDPKISQPFGQPGLTAKVQVKIALNEIGDLDILQASGTSTSLAEAAIDAVQQWRFAPFIGAGGQPERVSGLITLIFSDTGVEYDYSDRPGIIIKANPVSP